MVGVTGALLGAWCGMHAETRRERLAWFAVMNASLAWAFLAKGPAAWLVPVCALLALLVMERRWRVLRTAEFWLPVLIPTGAVLWWMAAAFRTPDGAHSLSVLLWANVAGRFTHLQSADAGGYSQGHRNFPGKYFVELPFYLAPWIFLFVAALRRAWHRAREPGGTAWRFALAVWLVPVLALSFASTARGIYFAPALPACALLIALWSAETASNRDRFDQVMLAATFVFVALFVVVLFVLTSVVASTEALLPSSAFLIIGALIALAVLVLSRVHWRLGRTRSFVACLFIAFVVAFVSNAVVLLPAIDRWQDIASVVRAVDRDTGTRTLVLYRPDETIVALVDRLTARRGPIPEATTPAEAARILHTHDPVAMLVLLRGRAEGPLDRRLRSWGIRLRAASATPGELDELCTPLGLTAERIYEVPQGRRYALLAQR